MNRNWRADAELDGRPAQPVTEDALRRAAGYLTAMTSTGRSAAEVNIWVLLDVAAWLDGRLGNPGSDFPVRMPVVPPGPGVALALRAAYAAGMRAGEIEGRVHMYDELVENGEIRNARRGWMDCIRCGARRLLITCSGCELEVTSNLLMRWGYFRGEVAGDESSTGGRYDPPQDRAAAVELVLAAFVTAAPERVSTPFPVTMRQAIDALRALGVDDAEIRSAAEVTNLTKG